MTRILVYGHKSSNFKMKAKFENEARNISTAHTIVELCAIRDGVAKCDVMFCTEASKIIDLISLE